jgi:hypothetical protein
MGGQSGGNRQDNRQRGNAAQLLEKYKNMARDAQLSGDRVQSEYYLQYAEHYFRVLSESRARFEDQRRQRDDDSDDEDDDNEETAEAADEQQDEGRSDRRERSGRGDRSRRSPRGESDRNAPRRGNGADDEEERIPVEALPPAIGRDEDGEDEEQETRPRRRARRPRADDSEAGETASAA